MTKPTAFEQWLRENVSQPYVMFQVSDLALAFSAGRAAGLEEAIAVADELMRQCEKTCQDLAEESSEAGVQMYLRADGAADALEQLAASIQELKDQSLKEVAP